MLAMVLLSCGRGGNGATDGEKAVMRYAQYLSITGCDGYSVAEITNPWDTDILVPESSPLPADLPQGTLIRTPIDRIIVYSSVHASIIDALGETDRITGVCEPEYMTCKAVLDGVAGGRITDCGSSVSPSVERIADAGGQVIIASPFQNSNYGAAGKLGLGCPDRADSLFLEAETEYNCIRDTVSRHIEDNGGDSHRPTLLAERKYGASWDVPGGGSYMARMYSDAGADYIFSGNTSAANVNMSFESVLSKGFDADIWVLKYWSPQPMTYASLEAEYRLYSEFRAFRQQHIFGCNTYSSTYYDDIVLHPAWILEDLAAVFHPDLFPGREPRYFKPL